MSRIGKRPIELPSGVSVAIDPGRVGVTGPLGSLQQQVPVRMQVTQEEGTVTVTRPTERGEDRALHGLTRTLIANMVEGVTKGFEKRLEIQGVGYRAALKGKDLELALGYSHPVSIKAPDGIEFEVPQPTRVIVKGISKQQVGEIALRDSLRKPVAAQQEPVAGLQPVADFIEVERLPGGADRSGYDIGARMMRRVFRADRAGIDQLLH